MTETWRPSLPAEAITPGPWRALLVARQACVIEVTTRRQVAGYMRPADAVLMAAAPELVAVVEQCLALWAGGVAEEAAHAALARLAEAALTKAHGPASGRPSTHDA